MKRHLVWTVAVVFLLFGSLGSREAARADDSSKTMEEMKAAIQAQAAEIEKLKKEREGQTSGNNRNTAGPRSFRYRDGKFYSFDQKEGAYCYLNEYGLKRCMQAWEVKSLECAEAEDGKLQCG